MGAFAAARVCSWGHCRAVNSDIHSYIGSEENKEQGHTYIYMCVFVCVCVLVRVCMYVSVCVCVYIYIYIYYVPSQPAVKGTK